jgi:hypothetical protein
MGEIVKVRAKDTFTAEQFDRNRFLRDGSLPDGCQRDYGVDEEGVRYEKRPVVILRGCTLALDHGDWIVTDCAGVRTKYSDGTFQEAFEPA